MSKPTPAPWPREGEDVLIASDEYALARRLVNREAAVRALVEAAEAVIRDYETTAARRGTYDLRKADVVSGYALLNLRSALAAFEKGDRQ